MKDRKMGSGMIFREFFIAADISQSIRVSSNSPSQLLVYAQESTNTNKKPNQDI
jgi:hypothetical protein